MNAGAPIARDKHQASPPRRCCLTVLPTQTRKCSQPGQLRRPSLEGAPMGAQISRSAHWSNADLHANVACTRRQSVFQRIPRYVLGAGPANGDQARRPGCKATSGCRDICVRCRLVRFKLALKSRAHWLEIGGRAAVIWVASAAAMARGWMRLRRRSWQTTGSATVALLFVCLA